MHKAKHRRLDVLLVPKNLALPPGAMPKKVAGTSAQMRAQGWLRASTTSVTTSGAVTMTTVAESRLVTGEERQAI